MQINREDRMVAKAIADALAKALLDGVTGPTTADIDKQGLTIGPRSLQAIAALTAAMLLSARLKKMGSDLTPDEQVMATCITLRVMADVLQHADQHEEWTEQEYLLFADKFVVQWLAYKAGADQ